jgi:hypothetical protein
MFVTRYFSHARPCCVIKGAPKYVREYTIFHALQEILFWNFKRTWEGW